MKQNFNYRKWPCEIVIDQRGWLTNLATFLFIKAYIYIYVCVRVCVCVCIKMNSKQYEKKRKAALKIR